MPQESKSHYEIGAPNEQEGTLKFLWDSEFYVQICSQSLKEDSSPEKPPQKARFIHVGQ